MSIENKPFDLMSLEADSNLSENGAWIEFIDDSRLLIAQANNSKHQAMLNKGYKKNRRKIDMDNKAADDLAEKISIEALAKCVLLDWEGISINGVITKYTPELGITLMTKLPPLRREVEDQSRRLENFQLSDKEEDLENLKPTSPGS